MVKRSAFPEVTVAQWAKLAGLALEPGARVEPGRLRSSTGMKASVARRMVIAFALDGAEVFWDVFHKGHWASERPIEDGFQPTPWRCPECHRLVSDSADLTYDVHALLHGPLELSE